MNLKESNRQFLSEKALGRVMVLLDGDIIIKRNKQRRNHTKRNRRNEKNGLKVRLCSGWRWTKRNKGTDKQQSVWEEKFLIFVLGSSTLSRCPLMRCSIYHSLWWNIYDFTLSWDAAILLTFTFLSNFLLNPVSDVVEDWVLSVVEHLNRLWKISNFF